MLEVHIQLNLLSIIRCHARNESYTSSSCRMYPCDNIPLFYYHICQPGAERPTFLHDFKNTIDATNCCIPSKPQILKSSKRSVGIYRFSSTFNTIIYHKLTTLRRFSHWIERQKKKQTNKKNEMPWTWEWNITNSSILWILLVGKLCVAPDNEAQKYYLLSCGMCAQSLRVFCHPTFCWRVFWAEMLLKQKWNKENPSSNT